MSSSYSCKYAIFDAHLHGVNFIQQTDGFQALLREMDKARVEKCVIFGLPVSKTWSEWENEEPNYYLSDEGRCYYYSLTDAIIAQAYMDLSADDKKRIIPLVRGFSPVDRYADVSLRGR
jgi:alpha-L-fucosidase